MNSLTGVSLRIGETGEYWKVTGELLWKGKALSGNKQNLAGEFCVVGSNHPVDCTHKNLSLAHYKIKIIAIHHNLIFNDIITAVCNSRNSKM